MRHSTTRVLLPLDRFFNLSSAGSYLLSIRCLRTLVALGHQRKQVTYASSSLWPTIAKGSPSFCKDKPLATTDAISKGLRTPAYVMYQREQPLVVIALRTLGYYASYNLRWPLATTNAGKLVIANCVRYYC